MSGRFENTHSLTKNHLRRTHISKNYGYKTVNQLYQNNEITYT